MGRKRKTVEQYCSEYEEFEIKCAKKSDDNDGILQCKYCNVEVICQANRIAEHLRSSWHVKLRSGMKKKRAPIVADSMPLQQRMMLSAPQVQIPSSSESLLQSQPLSPTKLKVTRQSNKLQTFSPKVTGAPPVLPPEEVCLRWNSHHSNMQTTFPQLLEKEQYVDVTLVADGRTLKCHRIILSSCSAYFEEILNGITPLQHPVIILKGIPYWILKSLTDFMYVGEVNIDQNKLPELLDVAELLKVKGLAGKSNNSDNRDKQENHPVKKQQVKDTNQRQQMAKNPPQITPVVTKVEEMPINDPLELLEPKFHEDSDGPASRMKENRFSSAKKMLTKKIRKRKSSEDEGSPPLFPMRRGTRSRPNVKIPKFYDYEDIVKPTASDAQPFSPIVTIKSEPVDVEENDVYNESGDNLLSVGNQIENTGNLNPDSNNVSANSKPAEKTESPITKIKSSNKEKEHPSLQYKIKIKCFSSMSQNTTCKPTNEVSGDLQENTASVSDTPLSPVKSGDNVLACDSEKVSEVTNSVAEINTSNVDEEHNAQNDSNTDEAQLNKTPTIKIETSPEDVETSTETSDQQLVDMTEK